MFSNRCLKSRSPFGLYFSLSQFEAVLNRSISAIKLILPSSDRWRPSLPRAVLYFKNSNFCFLQKSNNQLLTWRTNSVEARWLAGICGIAIFLQSGYNNRSSWIRAGKWYLNDSRIASSERSSFGNPVSLVPQITTENANQEKNWKTTVIFYQNFRKNFVDNILEPFEEEARLRLISSVSTNLF